MVDLGLTNVGRTAIDALQAKASAVGNEKDTFPVVNDLHSSLLRRVATALHSSSSASSPQPQHEDKVQRNADEDKSSRQNPAVAKRQTPLVNAGYRARMAAVSVALERYLEFAIQDSGASIVNVVMMGCGLDVLGLWACGLYPGRVRLYEVDAPEICRLKFRVLVQDGLIRPAIHKDCGNSPRAPLQTQQPNDVGTADDFKAAEGYVGFDAEGLHLPLQTESCCSYTLLAADLSDASSLSTAIAHTDMDKSRPTVVLSEVVLAYLAPPEVDSLLCYTADHLCASPLSTFLAYEPLGPEATTTEARSPFSQSVVSTYRQEYVEKFSSKLMRGKQTKQQPSSPFYPLGDSCASVVQRLRQCGFSSQKFNVDASLAARRWWSRTLPSSTHSAGTESAETRHQTELFDEQASLALFLRSYVVVCAVSANNTNLADAPSDGASPTMFETICPWATGAKSEAASAPHDTMQMERAKFRILPIQQAHERQVRTLYQTTYLELFDRFPAVKRMVDRAMETDLKADDKNDGNTATVHGNDSQGDPCAILRQYTAMGGFFWVAIIRGDDVDKRPRRSPSSSSGPKSREKDVVIGCVGVKEVVTEASRESQSIGGMSSRNSSLKFEIQRLSVHPAHRSRGIGQSLLEMVERFVGAASSESDQFNLDSSPLLVATTPSVLEAANQTYASCGFDVMEVKTAGKMSVVTYGKLL